MHVSSRRGRREAVLCCGIFAGVAAAVVLPFAVASPDGVKYSVVWQRDRGLQLESFPGGMLAALDAAGRYDATLRFGSGAWDFVGELPDALSTVLLLALVAAVAGIAFLYARTPRTDADLLLASAATVAAVVALAKVLSPQYLLWLLPLVPLVLGRRAAAAWATFVGALLLTHAFFPGRYDDLVAFEGPAVGLLIARNALLAALVVVLCVPLNTRAASRGAAGRAPPT
jgi:uncharacterized membrane protein